MDQNNNDISLQEVRKVLYELVLDPDTRQSTRVSAARVLLDAGAGQSEDSAKTVDLLLKAIERIPEPHR